MHTNISKAVLAVLVLIFGFLLLKQFESVVTSASSDYPQSEIQDTPAVAPEELFQLVPPTDMKLCNDGIDTLWAHPQHAKSKLLPKILQRSCFRFDSKTFMSFLKDKPVTLHLFDKTFLEFHPTRYELTSNLPKRREDLDRRKNADAPDIRYRWTGQIRSHGLAIGIGTFLINESRQTISGRVRYGRTIIRIRPLKDNLHAIVEIDPTGFPDEADPIEPSTRDQRTPRSKNETPSLFQPPQAKARSYSLADCTTGETGPYIIDILAFYTNRAGSDSSEPDEAIEEEINDAIEEANHVLELNETPLRLNPVGLEPAPYSDSGNLQTDLDALTGTGDSPRLSETVTRLRESSEADLVSLFIESGDSCGKGFQNSWSNLSAELAFSVVRRGCLDNLSLLHELGHNMGAGHDSSSNSSNFAHGHKSQTDKQRTIMAKKANCHVCTRVPFWSSPDHTYPDTTTQRGNSSANNTQVLKTTACQVSKFR